MCNHSDACGVDEEPQSMRASSMSITVFSALLEMSLSAHNTVNHPLTPFISCEHGSVVVVYMNHVMPCHISYLYVNQCRVTQSPSHVKVTDGRQCMHPLSTSRTINNHIDGTTQRHRLFWKAKVMWVTSTYTDDTLPSNFRTSIGKRWVYQTLQRPWNIE